MKKAVVVQDESGKDAYSISIGDGKATVEQLGIRWGAPEVPEKDFWEAIDSLRSSS